MPSVWGTNLKLSVFGESHGEAVGCVLDGFPAGVELSTDEIARFMKRRAPDKALGALSTSRTEPDVPRILSGVSKEGEKLFTNGFPLCAVIENTDRRASDYAEKMTVPRPNHADYPALLKYGEHASLAGGGHFSGRLTAPLVFAGAVCTAFLAPKGIEIAAHIRQILNVTDSPFPDDVTPALLRELKTHAFPTLDGMTAEAFTTILRSARDRGDSVGAKLECAAAGLPPALGEHMFGSVEGELSSLLFAIPGVKGVEFGAGFDFCRLYGSEANDAFEYRDGKVVTKTNRCGGILGGMTTGMPLIFRAAFKPTPSIAVEQSSVDLAAGMNVPLSVKGRHDPCVAVRAVPVIEAAAAVAVTNLMLTVERKL